MSALAMLLPPAWRRCPRCLRRLGRSRHAAPVRLLQHAGPWHEVCAACAAKLTLVTKVLMTYPPRNAGIVPTLEQTEWWYGQDGRPYRVAELEDDHLRNVISYLRRHATRLRDHRRWWETHRSAEPEDTLRARWIHELDARSAGDWLDERPLVRALEAELRRRDAVDGEVVEVAGDLGSSCATCLPRPCVDDPPRALCRRHPPLQLEEGGRDGAHRS